MPDHIDGAFKIAVEYDEIYAEEIMISFITKTAIWAYTTPDGDNKKLAEINNPRLEDIIHSPPHVKRTSRYRILLVQIQHAALPQRCREHRFSAR
jgi:hypothetical protein